jgi:hypothetical protein
VWEIWAQTRKELVVAAAAVRTAKGGRRASALGMTRGARERRRRTAQRWRCRGWGMKTSRRGRETKSPSRSSRATAAAPAALVVVAAAAA